MMNLLAQKSILLSSHKLELGGARQYTVREWITKSVMCEAR